MEEIWKDIEEYKGYYQVSNLGNVRSLDRIIKGNVGQPKKQKGAIVNQRIRGLYMAVVLCKGNRRKDFSVHRLVAEAFIPNKDNYPCVNHKDENKLNNRVDNLEWCSYSYNINYGTCPQRIGYANKIKHTGMKQPKLEKSNKSKWIILVNKNEKIKGAKTAEIKYGISSSNIIQCCLGKRKSAGKIENLPAIWKYDDGR